MYNILLNNEGVKHGKKSSNRKPTIQGTNQQSAADISTAFASLVIHFDNPSSDGAIIKSMQCQLDKIATAEKRIDTLNKHFNNTQI